MQFLFHICWLVKIHRECKRAKENLKGKYWIKNPYSGNFRQLFLYENESNTVNESEWTECYNCSWDFPKWHGFHSFLTCANYQSNFRTKLQMIQLNFSSLKCCLTFLGKISVTRFTETLFLYFEFRPMLKSM